MLKPMVSSKPDFFMYDPKSLDEFNRAYENNYYMTGELMESVHHFPCNACAAPDFMECGMFDVDSEFMKEHTCEHCGRTFLGRVKHEKKAILFSIHLKSGKPIDDWMPEGVISDIMTVGGNDIEPRIA